MTRLVRREVEEAQNRGGDWRAVVDALRPFIQSFWRALPLGEKQRFLRHVRPYWEAHRHRVAPEVIGVVERLEARRQLAVHKARIGQITGKGDRIEVCVVELRPRWASSFEVQFVLNCTGPETNYDRIEEPLVRNLVTRGLIQPDELRLGLRTDADGAVIGKTGNTLHNLFTIGTPRKGELYETTAVPELRVQAEALANVLAAQLRGKN